MPAKFYGDRSRRRSFQRVATCPRNVQSKSFIGEIFILDHKFMCNICSASFQLQIKFKHNLLAQKLFFSVSALVTLTSVVTLTFGSRSQKIYKVVRRYEMHLSTKNEANTSNGYGMVSTAAKPSVAAITATFQCLHAKSPNLWHANLRHRKTNLSRILHFRIWGSKKLLYTIGIIIIVYMWVLYGVLRTFQPALV